MNKLTKMARQLLQIEEDLHFRFDYSNGERPKADDFELYYFEQTWSDTSCGFGGIAGQAMTTENTYVFIPVGVNQKCFVYFGGRFAYAVDIGDEFWNDIQRRNMAPVYQKGKYLTTTRKDNDQ